MCNLGTCRTICKREVTENFPHRISQFCTDTIFAIVKTEIFSYVICSMFMIFICTRLRMPCSSDSLIIAIKLKANHCVVFHFTPHSVSYINALVVLLPPPKLA